MLRLVLALGALSFLTIGFTVTWALLYNEVPRPEWVLASATAVSMLVYAGAWLMFHLLRPHLAYVAYVGMLAVIAIALAAAWFIRLTFPLGMAGAIVDAGSSPSVAGVVAVFDLLVEFPAIVTAGLGGTHELQNGYLPYIWSLEVVLLCILGVRSFRTTRRQDG